MTDRWSLYITYATLVWLSFFHLCIRGCFYLTLNKCLQPFGSQADLCTVQLKETGELSAREQLEVELTFTAHQQVRLRVRDLEEEPGYEDFN